jgi:hypothetical protein
MNTNAMVRCSRSPGSTRCWARFTPASKIVIAAGEFVGFVKKLAAAYPTDTAIKLILDNQSAHISKKTRAWLADQPEGRYSEQGSGFASHPRENSRRGSWPTSVIATENPSSVTGPIRLIRQPDTSRCPGTLYWGACPSGHFHKPEVQRMT